MHVTQGVHDFFSEDFYKTVELRFKFKGMEYAFTGKMEKGFGVVDTTSSITCGIGPRRARTRWAGTSARCLSPAAFSLAGSATRT